MQPNAVRRSFLGMNSALTESFSGWCLRNAFRPLRVSGSLKLIVAERETVRVTLGRYLPDTFTRPAAIVRTLQQELVAGDAVVEDPDAAPADRDARALIDLSAALGMIVVGISSGFRQRLP